MPPSLRRQQHDLTDWTLELPQVQQAIVDAGVNLDELLRIVAEGATRVVPDALGAGVRVELSHGTEELTVGICTVPTAVAPLMRRGRSFGEIRVHARHSLASADNHAFTLLAGLASIAIGAADALTHARRKRARSEKRFNATFAQAPVGIAHVSPDGRFLMVNDQFAAITGYSRGWLIDNGFQGITHPDDLNLDLDQVDRLLSGEADRYAMEKRYIRPDGSTVWVNLTVALVRDAMGQPDFFVSVIEDQSEIRSAHEAAIRDPLTGLLNRRGFMERGARRLKAAVDAGDPIAIAYLDLDGFKQVNDTLGHPAGDARLIEAARAIEQCTRGTDVVGRLGGDEFGILMPRLDGARAEQAMRALCARLAAFHTAYDLKSSGSIGLLYLMPQADEDIAKLLARADEAMFVAKRAGGNDVAIVPG